MQTEFSRRSERNSWRNGEMEIPAKRCAPLRLMQRLSGEVVCLRACSTCSLLFDSKSRASCSFLFTFFSFFRRFWMVVEEEWENARGRVSGIKCELARRCAMLLHLPLFSNSHNLQIYTCKVEHAQLSPETRWSPVGSQQLSVGACRVTLFSVC